MSLLLRYYKVRISLESQDEHAVDGAQRALQSLLADGKLSPLQRMASLWGYPLPIYKRERKRVGLNDVHVPRHQLEGLGSN